MNKALQGWTLTETLVMMIVAGVVLLAVMDGVVLFSRYTARKTKEITDNMALYDGYYLLRHLAATADSVSGQDISEGGLGDDAMMRLFRGGEVVAELAQIDSMLVARRGLRTDTLMHGVSGLRLAETSETRESATTFGAARTDSILFSVRIPEDAIAPDRTELAISFPVVPSASRLVMKKLREQEKQYAYE